MQQSTQAVPTSSTSTIITILVCVCLHIMRFYLRALVQCLDFFDSSNVSLTNYSVTNDLTPEMTDEINYATGEAGK